MALAALARRIFGSPSDRHVKRFQTKVTAINALEPELEKLSDEALRARTQEFKDFLAKGGDLDDLIVPAFATVREAAKRVLGMRHFDVQLIGGMVMNERGIAEMRTGEGKTLVATLPMYLNALTGTGAHLVTVNDYLVKRDAAWMGQVYNFLGLSWGVIVHGLTDAERKVAYDEVQKIVWEKAPWIFLSINTLVLGRDKRLVGLSQLPDTSVTYEEADLK